MFSGKRPVGILGEIFVRFIRIIDMGPRPPLKRQEQKVHRNEWKVMEVGVHHSPGEQPEIGKGRLLGAAHALG